jgi:hypothetical protein
MNGQTPTWSCDSLTQAIDVAHANARRTFVVDRALCDPLIEIDALFRHLVDNLAGHPEQLAAAMLMRTHGYFLGGVSLALSGMVAEAHALLNRSLRTCMDGVFVAGDAHRQRLWTNRQDDEASRQRMQAEFKSHRVRQRLVDLDPATAEACEKLLHRTADHSHHPNAYAAPHRPEIADDADRAAPDGEYFVHQGEVQRFCLRTAAQVGIACLSVFYYVYGDLYRELELPARLTKLRQGH